jgi:hypothetical protein
MPISVPASETISAIAIRPGGLVKSPVAQFPYVVQTPPAPTTSLPPGSYTGVQSVTLSDADPGAVVHYTTDGSAPTAASASSEPISLAGSATLKAIAINALGGSSPLASFAYAITIPAHAFTTSGPGTATSGPAGSPISASTTSPKHKSGALGSLIVRKRYRLRSVRRSGLGLSVEVPGATRSVYVRIRRRGSKSLLYARDLPVPAGATRLSLSFKLRGIGAGSYSIDATPRGANGVAGQSSAATFSITR